MINHVSRNKGQNLSFGISVGGLKELAAKEELDVVAHGKFAELKSKRYKVDSPLLHNVDGKLKPLEVFIGDEPVTDTAWGKIADMLTPFSLFFGISRKPGNPAKIVIIAENKNRYA